MLHISSYKHLHKLKRIGNMTKSKWKIKPTNNTFRGNFPQIRTGRKRCTMVRGGEAGCYTRGRDLKISLSAEHRGH